MKLSQELTERGFVHQLSAESLSEITDGPKRTIYHGVDPSADSIHAGNFAVFMLLRHFVAHGHKVIFLVGGGTGMIGDPKPDVERPLTPPEVVAERVEKLRTQVERLLSSEEITFVNNHDWLHTLPLIDFLRETGKHFTVNELIKKEAIANRLGSETGISYTEFAYPLLQAYDYLTLHKQYGCDLQVGGSDQWGNIIAGVELVRRKTGAAVHAFTMPLIIDKATGKKFGKSEGNAVWLDARKTSPYQFYQFWFNTSDESVIDYLKIFTTLELSEIDTIERSFAQNPGAREAQKQLAHAVTTIVHGEEAATVSAKVSDLLFGGASLESLTEAEAEVLQVSAPFVEVKEGEALVDVLVSTGLASSKREARMFIETGAISLSGASTISVDSTIDATQFAQRLAILARGRKQKVVLGLT